MILDRGPPASPPAAQEQHSPSARSSKLFPSFLLLSALWLLPASAAHAQTYYFTGVNPSLPAVTTGNTACDGDHTGAIRYNTGTAAFEGCNGTAWSNINSGAAIKIDDLTDARYDIGADHNMDLGVEQAFTTGAAFNLFIGEGAGTAGTSNAMDDNTGVGYQALTGLTTGANNAALGYRALKNSTTGNSNTALGSNTMSNGAALLTGSYNTAVGDSALNVIQGAAANNTAIGANALLNNTTGNYNVAVGVSALLSNSAKSQSTAVGAYAMYYADSTAAGAIANNTAIGANALKGSATPANNTGTDNTAVGASTLASNTSGNYNIALGSGALWSNKAKSGNTALGYSALYYADDTATPSSSYNTAVGYNALLGSTTASANTGTLNTAVGASALASNTTGSDNVAVGYAAGQYISTGTANTAIGTNAMLGITGTKLTGADNTAVGDSALFAVRGAAGGNAALGYQAGNAVTTGTDNTLLGTQAGNLITGNGNIVVGQGGNITTGSNNILIGNSLTGTTAGTSSQLDIGDTIFGNITSDLVGIGAVPLDALSIGTAINASATHALLNLSNTALSGASALGTYIGANPAAFTGDFFNFQVGNYTAGRLTGGGTMIASTFSATDLASGFSLSGSQALYVPASTLIVGGSWPLNLYAGSAARLSIDASGNTDWPTDATTLRVPRKAAAGDPAGSTGMIYYNTNAGKFRCYQGAAWADCIGGGASVTLDTVAAATGAQAGILNGDNSIVWKWALTSAGNTAFTFTENTAATSAGAPAILTASTLLNSTAIPLYVKNYGNAASFQVDDVSGDTSPFVIDASGNVGIGTTGPTATLHVSPPVSAIVPALKVTGAVNTTNNTAGAEIPDLDLALARNETWATGALAMQRAVKIQPPTLAFAGASTVTNTASLGITGAPVLGANATITTTHALLISAGAVGAASYSYGLTVNAQTGAANNYTAALMGGNVGVGTSSPTAALHVSPVAAATGTLTALRVTGAANTNQTLSTEIPDLDINLARTVEWATGALATQEAVKIQPPTLGFVGASTVTNAATVGITGAPVKGANATVTNTHALLIGAAASVAGATNSYGLTVNAQTGATNNYAAQFMGGNVGIGTAAPTAALHVSPAVSAIVPALRVTGAVNTTNNTAGAETPDLDLVLNRVETWATNALTTQRAVKIAAPTYAFAGASTITDAATLGITGAPILGANATFTNTHALLISAGAVVGGGSSYGLTVNAQSGATANYAAQFMGGNVGIGDTSPASLFTVGSGDLFQVDTNGDVVKLKNVTYSWPASNASGVLTNNGSGTLSWAAGGSGARLDQVTGATASPGAQDSAANAITWTWNTLTSGYGLTLSTSGAGTMSGAPLKAAATSTTNTGFAGYFTNATTEGTGSGGALYASLTGTSNVSTAIYGTNTGTGNTGQAIVALNSSTDNSGSAAALWGKMSGAGNVGYGVYGANVSTAASYGVYGTMSTAANAGYGVYGNNASVTGTGYGVYSNGRLAVVPAAQTLAAAAGAEFTTGAFTAPAISFSGTATTTTAQMDSFLFTPETFAGAVAETVNDATTVTIDGAPVKGGSVVLGNTYGLKINTRAVSTATNSYGLYVDAMTLATNNYAAAFATGNVGVGTAAPAAKLHSLATTEQLRLGYDASNYASFTASSTGGLTINPVGSAYAITLGGGTTVSDLRFLEASANGTNYVGFKAPALLAANKVWELPAADGTSGYQLTTNGSGVLSWAVAGAGTPGGANTQVQFNDSSAFGGDAGMTYDKTNDALTVNGSVTLGLTAGANAPVSATVKSVTIQKFTATGAYTPAAGLLYCTVEVVGGGGGGGGAGATLGKSGGGGGGGGYARKTFPAATCTGFATVGAAGAAGTNGPGAGGGAAAANTSCFSTLTACGGTINLQATGGAGGAAGSAAATTAGGAGGVGTLGDVNASGGIGGNSSSGAAAATSAGGNGGSSIFGGGGLGKVGATGAGAAPANGYGGGGGGGNGATANAGGAGTAGVVIITEYNSQ
jgi:hypothetical protein